MVEVDQWFDAEKFDPTEFTQAVVTQWVRKHVNTVGASKQPSAVSTKEAEKKEETPKDEPKNEEKKEPSEGQ